MIFIKHAIAWMLALTMLSSVMAAENAPEHIEQAVAQARLAGKGSFRWFGLKIYDAQLWVGDRGYQVQAPTLAPLALDLRYARSLQGKKIAEASEDEMRKLNLGSAQERASWQAAMEKIFPDVNEGTHLTGVYLPKQGARFYLNGKFIGEIMDAAFAQAFFAIWLDPKTTASALRTALLTDASQR